MAVIRKTQSQSLTDSTQYAYDHLGQVTGETRSDGTSVTYAYDTFGNRTGKTENDIATSYTYDANNRLLTETTGGVTTTYTYDANGNTLSVSTPAHGEEAARSTTYTYNGFNQQETAVSGGVTASYAYNTEGLRIYKSTDGVRTQYLLEKGNVAAERIESWGLDQYLWGTNLISSGYGYYLYNAHGNVVQLTDNYGSVIESYEYDAFGVELNPSSTDYNPFRYCGEYYDTETGAYYLRARYYNPATGRFTQEDAHWTSVNRIYGDNPQKINAQKDKPGLKIYSFIPNIHAIAQSGNTYAYCMNNPLLFIDPTGKLVLWLVHH